MAQYNRNDIVSFMQVEVNNVASATELAENTAYGFDHPEWLDDETHIVWDLAVDIFDSRGTHHD